MSCIGCSEDAMVALRLCDAWETLSMKTNKSNEDRKDRIIGRKFAKELSIEDLKKATGGTTSCCSSGADDCDQDSLA